MKISFKNFKNWLIRKRVWFHVKWLFKKRYKIAVGYDPGNTYKKDNIVVVRYDRKYKTMEVIA